MSDTLVAGGVLLLAGGCWGIDWRLACVVTGVLLIIVGSRLDASAPVEAE